jgi:hypothetical protein
VNGRHLRAARTAGGGRRLAAPVPRHLLEEQTLALAAAQHHFHGAQQLPRVGWGRGTGGGRFGLKTAWHGAGRGLLTSVAMSRVAGVWSEKHAMGTGVWDTSVVSQRPLATIRLQNG